MLKVLLVLLLGLVAGALGMLIGSEFSPGAPDAGSASAASISMKRLVESASSLPAGYIYWFNRSGDLIAVQRCKTSSGGLSAILESQSRGLTRIEFCR